MYKVYIKNGSEKKLHLKTKCYSEAVGYSINILRNVYNDINMDYKLEFRDKLTTIRIKGIKTTYGLVEREVYNEIKY